MSHTSRRALAAIGLGFSLLLAGSSAWRYVQLGEEIRQHWRILGQRLDAPDTAAGDASARVARAVHENERHFDQLVLLTGARRTAVLLVVVGVAGSSIGAAAMRGTRSRPRRAGSQSPHSADHP